ncbi:AAA domain-containing protein [Sedimentibacter sp. MB31-C6]|uniref:AAA domain-containing protein n=1 Tax=Sedimentibacter sp. MB31-C6 TaxID=3109366 RepID=UPI002DDCB53C|nr:AAA domain-containing protein [Sedimentibacter sp. MB36-C1]WSI04613.1 AAA domain-containing protein [Sedimentibacter sp. MB36-C1]
MNILNNLVLIKDKDVTKDIVRCNYLYGKYEVIFNTSKQVYTYSYLSVKWFRNPQNIDANSIKISHGGKVLFDIKQILQFNDYYRIFFGNGKTSLYNIRDLDIEKNSLLNKGTSNCLEYFKCIADKVSIVTDEGKKVLSNQFEKMNFISSKSALETYLNPDNQVLKVSSPSTVYFPFGCNLSQMQAVSNAMSNKISVIEGPPGTGKTQTILNIIANAIINNKTVAVVSNNNSATENVYEKLQKYGFDFIAAPLGKSDNKKEFIKSKQSDYPDFNEYKYDTDKLSFLLDEIIKLQSELKQMLSDKNRIASLKSKLSEYTVEKKYFEDFFKETYDDNIKIRNISKLKSNQILELWNECQMLSEQNKKISLWFKLRCIFFYGIFDMEFLKKPISDIIPSFQNLFYILKVDELEKEIKRIEKSLETYKFKDKLTELTDKSHIVFKNSLYKKYSKNKERIKFNENDLWRDSKKFNNEYPIILSTTYSLKNCLDKDYIYDYVIVDESSQVDLITGVLTLSCAKNIVIVGDLMQLPNVIPDQVKLMTRPISKHYILKEGYNYDNNSLLSSICSIIPNVPRTMLREHYRCHPKIIDFCNRKFYDNQLVIMTEDHNERDVIKVYKTIAGNHARGHYNQRQIDEIKQEVIPELQNGQQKVDIGIISPYRKQTVAMQNDLSNDIDISTVHKYQGREKDDIIISSVDNEITDFTDNPNMLNVAVSRAKNRLRLVVSDNEKNENTNIGDLVKYIQYNNFEIINGDIYSVFDLLYSDYTEQRKKYLKKHNRISEYDSENLMYGLIKDVLNKDCFKKLDVIVHQPLNMLIHDPKKLSDDECKYAMNCATHLDFLIFNKLDKLPVLAVEVDGYQFHKEGTIQSNRDIMKDEILKKYNIPILRFKTNGSQEKEILESMLRQLLEI